MPRTTIPEKLLQRAQRAWRRRQYRAPFDAILPADREYLQSVLFRDGRPDENMDWMIIESATLNAFRWWNRPRFWIRRTDNTEPTDDGEYVPRAGDVLAGPFRL
jgi:hypothetical protein